MVLVSTYQLSRGSFGPPDYAFFNSNSYYFLSFTQMKRPKSPRRILEEIQENKHLQWSDTECSEAINVLEKGKSVCLDILTNILPNQYCGRQYFEELSTLLEVNRQICIQASSMKIKDFEPSTTQLTY